MDVCEKSNVYKFMVPEKGGKPEAVVGTPRQPVPGISEVYTATTCQIGWLDISTTSYQEATK